MTVFLDKRTDRWRYQFKRSHQTYSKAGFQTKREAQRAEAKRKEELISTAGSANQKTTRISTDMAFWELVNQWLDFLKSRRSEKHYRENCYLAKRWAQCWGGLQCSELTLDRIEDFLVERNRVSGATANKDIRALRSLFNYGIKRDWLYANPTRGLEWFPYEKKVKRVPMQVDIESIFRGADEETRHYLMAIRDTMARVGEIDRLCWRDVDLEGRKLYLSTRKKKGGNLTPRPISMTDRLYEVLQRRFNERDPGKPWVFWHRYWSAKERKFVEGPYKQRKRLMRSLCAKAGVDAFGFHALRHSGASILEGMGTSISTIQRILGHENRITTEIYLHSIGQTEREAINAFEVATTPKSTHKNTHNDKKGSSQNSLTP